MRKIIFTSFLGECSVYSDIGKYCRDLCLMENSVDVKKTIQTNLDLVAQNKKLEQRILNMEGQMRRNEDSYQKCHTQLSDMTRKYNKMSDKHSEELLTVTRGYEITECDLKNKIKESQTREIQTREKFEKIMATIMNNMNM